MSFNAQGSKEISQPKMSGTPRLRNADGGEVFSGRQHRVTAVTVSTLLVMMVVPKLANKVGMS